MDYTKYTNDQLWTALAESIKKMSNLLKTQDAMASGVFGSKDFNQRVYQMMDAVMTMQKERDVYDECLAELQRRSEIRTPSTST